MDKRFPEKLHFFTMSSRLRGYASALDEYEQKALIDMLNKSADLLQSVWDEYEKERSNSK